MAKVYVTKNSGEPVGSKEYDSSKQSSIEAADDVCREAGLSADLASISISKSK